MARLIPTALCLALLTSVQPAPAFARGGHGNLVSNAVQGWEARNGRPLGTGAVPTPMYPDRAARVYRQDGMAYEYTPRYVAPNGGAVDTPMYQNWSARTFRQGGVPYEYGPGFVRPLGNPGYAQGGQFPGYLNGQLLGGSNNYVGGNGPYYGSSVQPQGGAFNPDQSCTYRQGAFIFPC